MIGKKSMKLAGLVAVAGSLAGGGYALGQAGNVGSVAFVEAENNFHDHVNFAVMAANTPDEKKKEELVQKSMTLSDAPRAYIKALTKAAGDTNFFSDQVGKRLAVFEMNKLSSPSDLSFNTNIVTIELLKLQTAQNQQLIEQNKQMIQLLKDIKNKK